MNKMLLLLILLVLSGCASVAGTQQDEPTLSGKTQLLQSYCFQNMYGGFGTPPNYQNAALWCQRAAEQGNKSAQTLMGEIYLFGLANQQDYSQAMKWYHMAAVDGQDYGHAHAQFMLYHMLKNGLGVAPDDTAASEWLNMARQQGHAGAAQLYSDLGKMPQ